MHESSLFQPSENNSENPPPQNLKISADVPFLQFTRSEWYADFYCSVSDNGRVEFTVFPDPLSREDEAFQHFESEARKMMEVKANSKAAISLVDSFGLTRTGSFPYLETIVPDGLALSELCVRSPLTVYSLDEIAVICEQLTRAIAHCHNSGLLHGAISSRNVWYNHESGQYGLCGFGPSFLTPSQRLERIAGHPNPGLPAEELDGTLLCQSDIYAFSTLVFNLLLARSQGELPVEILSARENFYKDLVLLRSRAIANLEWTEEQKAAEASIPRWMMDMIYNSLHINPRTRFSHGIKLYDFVLLNHLLSKDNEGDRRVYNRPRINEVKAQKSKKNEKLSLTKPVRKKEMVAALCILLLVAAGFMFGRRDHQQASLPAAAISQQNKAEDKTIESISKSDVVKKEETIPVETKKTVLHEIAESSPVIAVSHKKPLEQKATKKAVVTPKMRPEDVKGHCSTLNLNTGLGDYKVKSFAYFHNKPDESTKRNAFVNHWNNTVLHAIREENDFIYIVFTNYWGQTSKGWLKKTDVIPVEQDQSSVSK